MLKQKRKIIILLLSAFLFMGAAVPFVTQARGLVPCGGYTGKINTDGSSEREPACNIQFLFAMIARVTNFLILSAGVFAVFEIVSAGFWLTVSQGNEENITKYKGALENAVVGFVFVMIAFVIINTAVNFLLLSNAPSNLKVDLTNPCSYLLAGSTCTK